MTDDVTPNDLLGIPRDAEAVIRAGIEAHANKVAAHFLDRALDLIRELPSEYLEQGGAIAPDEDPREYVEVIGRNAALFGVALLLREARGPIGGPDEQAERDFHRAMTEAEREDRP